MAKSQLYGKKVLIVDDEPDVLDTLEELLFMCQVTRAGSFEEARQRLEREVFDLAILDIMGVDGYKLLELANQKKVPAVMLTAHALSVKDTVKSFKRGAAYFIPKEEMGNIVTYLSDILEAQSKGKSLMERWLDRMDAYYEKRFGKDWKEDDPDFWKRFPFLY
jgi:DNA-binding NtrC family response regulator